MMKVVKPDFYDKFVCIADRCSMTCCQEWKIAVDDETYKKWKKTAPPDTMRTRKKNLGAFITYKDNTRVIALEKDHRCPFLNEDKLCKLVMTYGDEILSETCSIFPREVQDFESRKEYSLMTCCPAVIDLLQEQDEIRFISQGEEQGETTCEDSEKLLFQIRDFFLTLMQDEAYMPGKALLMIYYLALEMLRKEHMSEADLAEYQKEQSLAELSMAMEAVVPEQLFTIEERNELFLDLAVNYRKEGLYQDFLERIAASAEQMSEAVSSGDALLEKEIEEKWKLFQNEFAIYQPLMRKFLVNELFSNGLMPEGDMESILVELQWIAMEYAVMEQSIFLRWMQDGKISYEMVRDYMAVVSRMTGYDEADIYAYLENSFEHLVWDWGYFALVVGR